MILLLPDGRFPPQTFRHQSGTTRRTRGTDQESWTRWETAGGTLASIARRLHLKTQKLLQVNMSSINALWGKRLGGIKHFCVKNINVRYLWVKFICLGKCEAQGMNFRATWLELALARSRSGSWIMEKTLTATDVTSSILHHMNPSIHLQPTNLLLHLSNTTSASPVSLFFVSSIVSRGFKGFCSSVHLPADSSSSSSSPWWLLHNVVLSLRFKKKETHIRTNLVWIKAR